MTATIAVQELLDNGQKLVALDAACAAATDVSNQFYNTGSEVIVVVNTSAGVRTVTVKAAPDPFGRGGGGADDVAIAIPAGKTGITGFLNPAMFNTGGLAAFTLDAIATTAVGVFRFRKLR